MHIEHLKYITVIYYDPTVSVKLMVQEHYDIPEYNDTLFFINTFKYNTPEDVCSELRKHTHKIYYMLEHNVKEGTYSQKQYDEDIDFINIIMNRVGITEFWTMDYEPVLAKIVHEKYNIPIIYKPVRYTSLIKPVKDIQSYPKQIDLCHIGYTFRFKHRIELMNKIETYPYYISIKLISGTRNLNEAIPELNTSKYILDTIRVDNILTQNQVRIFELLCMGYTVCTEKCSLNMFPGLVYEFGNVDELYDIIKRNEYLHPTEVYKEMTYTDEAYEKYVNNLIKLQTV